MKFHCLTCNGELNNEVICNDCRYSMWAGMILRTYIPALRDIVSAHGGDTPNLLLQTLEHMADVKKEWDGY